MTRPPDNEKPAAGDKTAGSPRDHSSSSVHQNSDNSAETQAFVEQSGVNHACLTASVTEAEETAARIRAMMGDRSTDAERQARIRRHRAVKSCSHCVVCWKPIEAGQTIFREQRYGRDFAPVCEGCKSRWTRHDAGSPCEGCRRVVHNVISGRSRKRTFCCDRCAIGTYSREKHARRVRERGTRECLECAEVFEPARADARFCSVACKQKSYRHRVTDRICPHNNDANSIRNGQSTAFPGESNLRPKPLNGNGSHLANATDLPQQNGGAGGQF